MKIDKEKPTVLLLPVRKRLTEVGYTIMMSLNGTTYKKLKTGYTFAILGTLVDDYSANTPVIDDSIGFEIDFDNADINKVDTIDRSFLFDDTHLALLGGELITFQTITPVSANRYKLENINRGFGDNLRLNHVAGEKFYFIGADFEAIFTDSSFIVGSTRYFKYYVFSSKGTALDSVVLSLTITGRVYTPFSPINLKANSLYTNVRYTDDIVLTWAGRCRTTGAGFGDADTVVDASPTWEGLFEVEVWVNGVLKRTTSSINALTWTYSSAMNISDNSSLADIVTFKVCSYLTRDNLVYRSNQITLTVKKVLL
jgi:hypothetical protein